MAAMQWQWAPTGKRCYSPISQGAYKLALIDGTSGKGCRKLCTSSPPQSCPLSPPGIWHFYAVPNLLKHAVMKLKTLTAYSRDVHHVHALIIDLWWHLICTSCVWSTHLWMGSQVWTTKHSRESYIYNAGIGKTRIHDSALGLFRLYQNVHNHKIKRLLSQGTMTHQTCKRTSASFASIWVELSSFNTTLSVLCLLDFTRAVKWGMYQTWHFLHSI